MQLILNILSHKILDMVLGSKHVLSIYIATVINSYKEYSLLAL